ncbi:type VI secretion system baseplate subunit TssG [Caballeronia ptereochthonis]|uniref:Type VI secretion protein n=1 Tax=Caballeronia ptereochthonis TaxID=1777144 RepID=A0A158A937_9BURK|nr:type VI secretion system baseplate subunit TssG [Caballeronia ptereochthonis]SAK54205.1 type VI secretion protein [Caballeronia ptereochthonis]
MAPANPMAALCDTPLSREEVMSLKAEPWRYGFLALLRRIGANAHLHPVGTAARPGAEPFRLGQQPGLTFAPREIAGVGEMNGRLHVRLFGLGMLGPNGPLPMHVTEIAREREFSRRDTTLSAFLDVFHHRYLTLLYRAWACAQSAAGLDRPGSDSERFSFYAGCLTGQDTHEIARRALPPHAHLAASASLVREAREPDGLRMTLARYFGVPVSIEEYVFHWIGIAEGERSRLGQPGAASTMGEGAVLGEQVPDRQYRFRIVIGPLDIGAYLRFTPRGADLPLLMAWVRSFVGHAFEWELELRIRQDSATPATIGGPEQLGWSGWLGGSAARTPPAGMRFEPEGYTKRCARRAQEGCPSGTTDSEQHEAAEEEHGVCHDA